MTTNKPDDESSELKQPTVDWNTALAVLYIIQEKVSWAVYRPVVISDEILADLQSRYEKDSMGFWTVVDQFYERLLRGQWDTVPPDGESAYAAAILARIHPVPCDIPEVEFVQTLLGSLWLADNNIDGQFGLIDSDPADNVQQDAAAREQMIMLAEQNVYTWEAAKEVIDKISSRLREKGSSAVSFDDKHLQWLHTRYTDDPLGFWSVLDQIQQRLMDVNWREVQKPSGYIQKILKGSFTPSNNMLSDFMAAAIPTHSLVPYGHPPTFLRTEGIDTFSPQPSTVGILAQSSSSSGSPLKYSGNGSHPAASGSTEQHKGNSSKLNGGDGSYNGRRVQPPAGQQQQKQALAQQLGAGVTMATVDPEANYPYCWRAVLEAIDAIQKKLYDKFERSIVFDEKHKQDLFARWMADPKGFFSVLDQIQERLYQTNWDTVRDDGRYIQSLIAKFDPQTVVSTFIQSFVTPPEVAAAAAAASQKVAKLIDLDWDVIVSQVIPALEERVSDRVGRQVRFDEKHKQHFKQRFDRDQQAFWSVLDQVQDRMSASDWSNVRAPQRFIQSFITKAQPTQTFTPSLYMEHVLRTVHEHGDPKAVWPELKKALEAESDPAEMNS